MRCSPTSMTPVVIYKAWESCRAVQHGFYRRTEYYPANRLQDIKMPQGWVFWGLAGIGSMQMSLSERILLGKTRKWGCTRLTKSRPRKAAWMALKPILACHSGALVGAGCVGFQPRTCGRVVAGLPEARAATTWRVVDCVYRLLAASREASPWTVSEKGWSADRVPGCGAEKHAA